MSLLKTRSVVAILIAGVAAITIVWVTWYARSSHRTNDNGTSPFQSIAATSVFRPYIFDVLDGFAVVNSTISYSQGVLVFQLMNNSHQSIAVTEQILPQTVANGVDPNATKVGGVDGSAIITYNGTQTTGALFSRAHRGVQTMVLINTTSPIPQSTVEDLLRGLRALS